jgi:hypothetical protein
MKYFWTALIIVLVLLSVLTAARALFYRQAKAEANQVLSTVKPDSGTVIQPSDLHDLPECVAKWLQRSKVIGKERIKSVYLIQQGRMRLSPEQKWIPLQAVQYINVDDPGFVWIAHAKMAPFVDMYIRDKYENGQGSMKGKLLGLIPVINAQPGGEMNQGTLLRFMAEMIWYPSAALQDYITWEEIDTNSARATMTWQGASADTIYYFNDQGDIVSSVASRYQEVNGHFELHDWGGIAREYKDFSGVRLQNKSDIIWKYETGDFNWLQIEVTEVQFNRI